MLFAPQRDGKWIPLPVAALAVVTVLGLADRASPQDWPQWRGPLGQGITSAVNLPPAAGVDTLKEVWKTPIPGEGCSSPVVSQGRVYLTTAYEGTERHPWDQPASWASLVLAGLVVGLALTQAAGVGRGLASRPVFMAGLCAWTLAVVVVTAVVLAKPRWFWQFADPWTGTRLARAELLWVEEYFGRPAVVLAVGSLVLLFVHLTGTTRAEAENPAVPSMLPRWHRFLTLAVVVVSSVALGLVGGRSDWFFPPTEPWLAWIVTGGLGTFALAGGIGGLGPGGKWKLLQVAAALAVVGWLFVNTPSDEFGMPLGLQNRLTYLVPAAMLLASDAWIFLLPRRPTDAPHPIAIPGSLVVLIALLGGVVFLRPNYLEPQTGVVRAVVCLDAGSGEVLWRTPVYVAAAEKRHSLSSMATPTPACDGERIYAYFGSGLAALDTRGHVLWLKRDPEFAGFIRYGAGSSVALAGDRIIIYRDSEFMGHGGHLDDDIQTHESRRPSALIAYDKKTGDEVWSVTPPFSHDSYMTPLVWTRDGRLELVIATWKTLAGFAADDGQLRWSHPHPMQQIVPSPAVNGDCLYVMGGNQLPCPIIAVRAPSPERPAPETAWFVRMIGGNISSPVCWNGLLFSMAHNGMLTCQDAETGHAHWSKRLRSRCLASLVAGDGKVYVLDQEGTLHVFAADATGTLLATHSFEENCSATPALAEGAVFVRTAHHVIRLETLRD